MSRVYSPEQWIEAYARAWREMNLTLAADLWTEVVRYSFDPFGPLIVGCDAVVAYWKQTLASQSETDLHVRLWATSGDLASAEWWVSFLREEKYITLSASLLLKFAFDGRCCELHEHWLQHEGRIPPTVRFTL